MSYCERVCKDRCFYEKHQEHQKEHGGLTEAEWERFQERLQGDPYNLGCQDERKEV